MMNVKQILTYMTATAIPICLWAKLIQQYLKYKQQCIEKQIAHSKHNCVVTYSKEAGMCGWPDYPARLPLNLDSYNKFLEPIIYFIDTSTSSLDISVMILSSKPILDALARASDRGIKIRLILDAMRNNNKYEMHSLTTKGVKILYDQKFLNTDTMMHNKYAVKDFNGANGSGFTLCGSLNWTQSAFNQNYEFVVFSSNRQVVSAFNKNFMETWEYFQKVKETTLLNETMYQL